jgi:hypothetical protein
MSPDAPQPQTRDVPVVWVGSEEVPVFQANAFIAQTGPFGEFFVTVGQLVPPAVFPGSEEEIRQQVEQITYVPAKTVCRLALNATRMRELKTALETALETYEKMPPELKGAEPK